MIPRVLEPEVMDTAEEAADYDAMDHGEVNRSFCGDLLAEAPELGRTLDAGTGTALIPIELCSMVPAAHVLGIDLAESMLALGRRNVTARGLDGRIDLRSLDAKATGLGDGIFDTVFSNSLVHHVPDTRALLRELGRLVTPGGLLFVRDLARPASDAAVAALVDRYAPVPDDCSGETRARLERQRALFDASLRAALTVDEVERAAANAMLSGARVVLTSDRHFTLRWTRS